MEMRNEERGGELWRWKRKEGGGEMTRGEKMR